MVGWLVGGGYAALLRATVAQHGKKRLTARDSAAWCSSVGVYVCNQIPAFWHAFRVQTSSCLCLFNPLGTREYTILARYIHPLAHQWTRLLSGM